MRAEFAGFEEPKENWSKLPHALIEAMPQIETSGELKVILYILRHTWGYHNAQGKRDVEKKITLDEFMHGRRLRDRSRMDTGLGLSKPTIIDGLRRAEQHGFIEVDVDDSDGGRIKKFYRLKMSSSFTSYVKKPDPPGKETLHPTEKETIERNPREETHGADATHADKEEEILPHSGLALDSKKVHAPGGDSVYTELSGAAGEPVAVNPAVGNPTYAEMPLMDLPDDALHIVTEPDIAQETPPEPETSEGKEDLLVPAPDLLSEMRVVDVKQLPAETDWELLAKMERVGKKRAGVLKHCRARLNAPPLAVVIYQDVVEQFPNRKLWPEIVETVGEDEANLEFWEKVVIGYVGRGWNPFNVTNMLDFYRRREVPTNGRIGVGQIVPVDDTAISPDQTMIATAIW